MKIHTLRLKEFMPYRLSVLTNRISDLIARVYVQRFDIGVSHWRVIAVLGEEPGISATQVAARTAQDKVTVTRAVQYLVEKGLVRRRASQTDGRVSHLVLTARGQRVCAEITPAALSCEQSLLAALSPEERRQLDVIVGKLMRRVAELDRSSGDRVGTEEVVPERIE